MELDAKCNKTIMLTTYFLLWKALPNRWEKELEIIEKDSNMEIPLNIVLLIKDKKGTSNIMKVWKINVNDNTPTGLTN